MYAVVVENRKTQIVETQTGTKEQMWHAYKAEIDAAKKLGWMLLDCKSSIGMMKMAHSWINHEGQTVNIVIGPQEQ